VWKEVYSGVEYSSEGGVGGGHAHGGGGAVLTCVVASLSVGTQFACFTRTKVQILTQKAQACATSSESPAAIQWAGGRGATRWRLLLASTCLSLRPHTLALALA
jgi:hypothetical protein